MILVYPASEYRETAVPTSFRLRRGNIVEIYFSRVKLSAINVGGLTKTVPS